MYMGKGHSLSGASKYYYASVYQGILVGGGKETRVIVLIGGRRVR
jgi:hypothetical protein